MAFPGLFIRFILLLIFCATVSRSQNLHFNSLGTVEEMKEFFQFNDKRMASAAVVYCDSRTQFRNFIIKDCLSKIQFNHLVQRTTRDKEVFFQLNAMAAIKANYLHRMLTVYCNRTNILGVPVVLGPGAQDPVANPTSIIPLGEVTVKLNLALMFKDVASEDPMGYSQSQIDKMIQALKTVTAAPDAWNSIYISFEASRFARSNAAIHITDFKGVAGVILYTNPYEIGVDVNLLHKKVKSAFGGAANSSTKFLVFLPLDIPQKIFSRFPTVRWNLLPYTNETSVNHVTEIGDIVRSPKRYIELAINPCKENNKYIYILNKSCKQVPPVHLMYLLQKSETDMVMLFKYNFGDTPTSMNYMNLNIVVPQFMLLNVKNGPNTDEGTDPPLDLDNKMPLAIPFQYVLGFLEKVHRKVDRNYYSSGEIKALAGVAILNKRKVDKFGFRLAAQFLGRAEEDPQDMLKSLIELTDKFGYLFLYDIGFELDGAEVETLKKILDTVPRSVQVFLSFDNKLREQLYEDNDLPLIPTDATTEATTQFPWTTQRPNFTFPTIPPVKPSNGNRVGAGAGWALICVFIFVGTSPLGSLFE